MKYQLCKFAALVAILLILSILFGVWFYYYYALENIDSAPLKESISLSLTFLGSFGTLVSIFFAFYLYLKQQEKDRNDAKKIILSKKPKLFITIGDVYEYDDDNYQPALAVDLKIKNYTNTASSFSLNFDYKLDGKKEILVDFDYSTHRKTTLHAGDDMQVTAIFISSKNIMSPPKFNELDVYIKCVYLDGLNNNIEDYYLITSKNMNSIQYIKSNILTVDGRFIEVK